MHTLPMSWIAPASRIRSMARRLQPSSRAIAAAISATRSEWPAVEGSRSSIERATRRIVMPPCQRCRALAGSEAVVGGNQSIISTSKTPATAGTSDLHRRNFRTSAPDGPRGGGSCRCAGRSRPPPGSTRDRPPGRRARRRRAGRRGASRRRGGRRTARASCSTAARKRRGLRGAPARRPGAAAARDEPPDHPQEGELEEHQRQHHPQRLQTRMAVEVGREHQEEAAEEGDGDGGADDQRPARPAARARSTALMRPARPARARHRGRRRRARRGGPAWPRATTSGSGAPPRAAGR